MKKLIVILAALSVTVIANAQQDLSAFVNSELMDRDRSLSAYILETEKTIKGDCKIKKDLTYTYPYEDTLFASADQGFTVHINCVTQSNKMFTVYVKGELAKDKFIKSTRISLLP